MSTRRATPTLAWMAVLLALGIARGADDEPPRVAIISRSLASVSFKKESRTLEVEFRSGAVYRYRDVPETAYRELLRAESKGRFFTQRIRGKFPFERVRTPKQ